MTGSPYLVSELLEGETLRDLLQRGPLTQRKAIEYGVQIAQGLAAAHEKQIVHRDLKPENIFVTHDGRLKILDFGLAKLEPKPANEPDSIATTRLQTSAGMVMGTASYMAPNRCAAIPSIHAPTSSLLEPCFTRCSPASASSTATQRRRP